MYISQCPQMLVSKKNSTIGYLYDINIHTIWCDYSPKLYRRFTVEHRGLVSQNVLELWIDSKWLGGFDQGSRRLTTDKKQGPPKWGDVYLLPYRYTVPMIYIYIYVYIYISTFTYMGIKLYIVYMQYGYCISGIVYWAKQIGNYVENSSPQPRWGYSWVNQLVGVPPLSY